MPAPAPFLSSVMTVEPQWIDYNGHMNMAFYNVLFDRCGDQAYDLLGLGEDYARTQRHTTYTAEFHIRYVRELHEGDQVRVSLQMIDHNDRCFHTYQEIRHQDGWLAATGETLGLHIDMAGPRVVPFPPEVAARIAALAEAHAPLPREASVGRGIAIRRRSA